MSEAFDPQKYPAQHPTFNGEGVSEPIGEWEFPEPDPDWLDIELDIESGETETRIDLDAQMTSLFIDPENIALIREADGLPPVSEDELTNWFNGLSEDRQRQLESERDAMDRHYNHIESVHQNINSSAPELYLGRLPTQIEEALGGRPYALGFNQSGAGSIEEALEYLEAFFGINITGYNLHHRFMMFDPSEDLWEGQPRIVKAVDEGYYGNAANGRFVVALPVESDSETPPDRIVEAVNLRHELLPEDFQNHIPRGDEKLDYISVSRKYVAGFIDENGAFWVNEFFGKEDRANFSKYIGEDLLPSHKAAIQKAIGSVVLENKNEGEFAGTTWVRQERLGKQQPVSLMKFKFSDGTESELVFRPDSGNFSDLYNKFPVVRRHYPQLFMSHDSPYGSGSRPIHVIEKIEGHHGDNWHKPGGNEQFHALLEKPDKFEQLCQDMFTVLEDIFAEPLMIYDVRPAIGHNVIFNIKTDHFQIFDIGTIRESDMPAVQKFLEFLQPGQQLSNPREAEFIMRMAQLYMSKHPNTDLSFESPIHKRAEPTVLSAIPENTEGVIVPGDDDYEDAYKWAVHWMGTRGKSKDQLPAIKTTIKTGKTIHRIEPGALEAIEKNDALGLMHVLNENRGKITTKIFVEI